MAKEFRLYKVGGFVRDSLLGIKSKDIDFSFEFSEEFISEYKDTKTPEWFYDVMNKILKQQGYSVFQETKSCFTTRAQFPTDHENAGLVADFVLCRKETYLDENSRTPTVEMGNIYDDLSRRDATLNAIAIDESGRYLDPHNGIQDLFKGVLRCPISPGVSFSDDPLRILRFLRFSITKGFTIDDQVYHVICNNASIWDKFDRVVSKERVYNELFSMFRHDTVKTLALIEKLKKDARFDIMRSILPEGMWLKPTFENVK